MRILCLASGRGSNFAAILSACVERKITNCEVVGLISNVSDAMALDIARRAKIKTTVVDSNGFRAHGVFDRMAYEAALEDAIASYSPDLLCLTGYMLILGERIINHYSGRILNVHPSLLPSFKGLRAQKQALTAGVKWTGCTVHYVESAVDSGKIIEQNVVRIEEGETEESLSQKLLPLEHEAYIRALRKIALQIS